jgi:hypothetical protein
MKSDLVRRLTPEEEELATKREELSRLEAQLADQELSAGGAPLFFGILPIPQ